LRTKEQGTHLTLNEHDDDDDDDIRVFQNDHNGTDGRAFQVRKGCQKGDQNVIERNYTKKTKKKGIKTKIRSIKVD